MADNTDDPSVPISIKRPDQVILVYGEDRLVLKPTSDFCMRTLLAPQSQLHKLTKYMGDERDKYIEQRTCKVCED